MELLAKGGITVVILLFFSVISIAVMIERAWTFRRFRIVVESFYAELSCVVKDSGVGGYSPQRGISPEGGNTPSAATALCASKPSPLSAVYLAGYAKKNAGRDEVLRAMELAGRGEVAKLDRFVGVLGTIGSTAPFVGLFGTVLGIIRAFSGLAASQGASPAAVADGIAEALVATAVGLFVAVPAVIAYNYFVRTVNKHALNLETTSSEFVEHILSGDKDGMEDKRQS